MLLRRGGELGPVDHHRRLTPRLASGAILLSLWICGCAGPRATPRTDPLCVSTVAALPESWRPSAGTQKSSSSPPWSPEETADAAHATRAGLAELSAYFTKRPASVKFLWDDAVEPFMDASYAAGNMPELQSAAREGARRIVTTLMAPYFKRGSVQATCDDFLPQLSLTIYAHQLFPAKDARVPVMVTRTNAAYRDCGSLAEAMGYDYRERLAASHVSNDEVWDLVMWSITLTDAQLVPGLALPPEARDLPPALWRFLQHYPLAGARAYPDGARNEMFYDTAYLATHIAYIPTGYGRHPIYIADAPELYRFLRQNFYAVMEMGELDMVAEFVDLFRQYGCTEQSDVQLRDGTRYLLKLFHAAGDSWIAYKEPDQGAKLSDYSAIHKAWTGMSGVRVRVPEPPAVGTYGGVVRQWLGYPGYTAK